MVAPRKDEADSNPATQSKAVAKPFSSPTRPPGAKLAFDDLVPEGALPAASSDACATTGTGRIHQVERELQRQLRDCDELLFDSLTVRQIPGGVCVQGTAHGRYDRGQVAKIVRRVAQCEKIVDQVVTRCD